MTIKSFEDMVLPEGKTLDEIIKASVQEIARVGKANERFQMVDVCGMKMVEANPEVKEAWRKRRNASLKPE